MASGLRWPLMEPKRLTLPPKTPALANTMSLASLILPAEMACGECLRRLDSAGSAESGKLRALLLLAWFGRRELERAIKFTRDQMKT